MHGESGQSGGPDAAADPAAVLRWFTRTWRGTVGGEAEPSPVGGHGARLTAAAARARSRYPGAAGELIRREILAFADTGFRFDGSGLVPRIVDELLTGPRQPDR